MVKCAVKPIWFIDGCFFCLFLTIWNEEEKHLNFEWTEKWEERKFWYFFISISLFFSCFFFLFNQTQKYMIIRILFVSYFLSLHPIKCWIFFVSNWVCLKTCEFISISILKANSRSKNYLSFIYCGTWIFSNTPLTLSISWTWYVNNNNEWSLD